MVTEETTIEYHERKSEYLHFWYAASKDFGLAGIVSQMTLLRTKTSFHRFCKGNKIHKTQTPKDKTNKGHRHKNRAICIKFLQKRLQWLSKSKFNMWSNRTMNMTIPKMIRFWKNFPDNGGPCAGCARRICVSNALSLSSTPAVSP